MVNCFNLIHLSPSCSLSLSYLLSLTVLAPIPNSLVRHIRKYPNIHDEDYAQRRFGAGASMAPLVLPYVQGETRRVLYQVTEYAPLLDSSNMTMNDWARIANDIYVSSSLSFLSYSLSHTLFVPAAIVRVF